MKIYAVAFIALAGGFYALFRRGQSLVDSGALSPGSAVSDAIDTASNIVQNKIIAPVVTAFGTEYDSTITGAALANGIDPQVLYKLLYNESHFRADIISGKVKSRTGALGIAQFMPATAAEELGSVDAALNPYLAIPGAARYLAKLIRATGSVPGGVAAYNWGIGNVLSKGLKRAPSETVAYVNDILGVNITA